MLIVKFISAFFIGGLSIAIQSFFAEKYPKLGGYIISLPTTLPISLFFISWISGNNEAMEANFAVPFSIMNLIVFSYVILQLLIFLKEKVIYANLLSLAIWFLISISISVLINNIPIKTSLVVCFIYIHITHLFFKKNININNEKAIKRKKTKQIFFRRSLISGAVVTVSSLLSYYLSPFWGGIFAVFPASYISNYNFIYASGGIEILKRIIVKVPKGSIFFAVYSLMFWQIDLDNIIHKTLIVYILTILIGITTLYLIDNIGAKEDT